MLARLRPILAHLRPLLDAFVRVLAVFGLLNLALGLAHPDLDANWLWLGLAAEGPVGTAAVCLFSAAVLGWSWAISVARPLARLIVLLVAVACAVDTVGYYRVLVDGSIRTHVPIPLSVLCAVALAFWAARPPLPARGGWSARVLWHAAAAGLWITGLVGSVAVTDYARPADAIVVFGAAVWSDGTPSDALRDRTRTALTLYARGLAPTLVFSGGHGPDAPVSEPEAMKRMALEAGVDPAAILLDESGVDTASTVVAVAEMARGRAWRRVLMVSHDYHLARIKLACARQGLQAYTVPAVEPLALARKPYYVLRELAAMAWYWVHPLKTVRRVEREAR